MSDSPKKNSPAPTFEAAAEDAVFNWEKHVRWLAPATLGILVVATAFLWLQSRRDDVREEVYQAYMNASTADELEAVSVAYPEQDEAPLALLQAAALRYNDGEYEAAKLLYRNFTDRYRGHPFADNAVMGLLLSREAVGELGPAMEGFQAYTEDNLLYPEALMGRARIHEKQSELKQAAEVYAQIREEFPDSVWAAQAEEFGKMVEIKLRRNP